MPSTPIISNVKLQMEKKKLTKNHVFHLSKILIGVSVMDAFLLAYHHQVINISSLGMGKQKISIQMFTGILSHQLTHRQDASVKVHHDSTQILLWTLFPFFVTKIPQRVVYQTILLTLSRNRRDKKSVT